ncbi:MAG: hypothetical protein GX442_08120 [Candidatus Riflebacteria bacterium]|nr:hypothetical protein [Candidatus Riflebacteria bacterium]
MKSVKPARVSWFLVAGLLLTVYGLSGQLFGMAAEYTRNGEVYVLIGDGAEKGVYRLNDPAGEGVPYSGDDPLYDPGTSYGISVNLNRHVFTFTETIANGYILLPGNIDVDIKPVGQNIMQGFHCDHRSHWSEHFTPIYTTSGTPSNYPGYYTLTPTSYGYSAYRSVGSCCGCGAPKVANTWPVYVVSRNAAGKGNIPNGSWYQSKDADTAGRPGKAYRDRVEGKAHNYDLLEWWAGISGNTPTNRGKRAESYEKKIYRAILGSCIDPCGTNQTNLTQDADPQYVSISLSSMGRTYCYTRTQTSTSDGKVTLDLADYGGPLVGSTRKNDLSTQWVGCSLRNTGSDYVYVLGSQVIKDWLTALGYTIPAGFNVTSVSVSDQWYLKGGIVFAYNAGNGRAYQFTRTENSDGSEGSTSFYRSIDLGTGIDDIKADGNGDLFYGKTAYFPPNATGFSPADVATIAWTAVSPDTGVAKGRLVFNQKVTKSVYQLPNGATAGKLVNGVFLGNNKWEQFFWVPMTLSDGRSYLALTRTNYVAVVPTADWHWIDTLPAKDPTPSVALPTRVQLGVINVAAPPDPGGASSVVDIVGPVNDITTDVPQGYYTFRVENAPRWERDDWNANNKNNVTDTNGNGTLGYFVATVSKAGSYVSSLLSDHVVYEWAIYQIQDAYGKVLTPAPLVAKSGSGSSPAFAVSPDIGRYFTAGVYQIMCRAKFKWYNYNALPFGSTVLDKPSVLVGFDMANPAPWPASLVASQPAGFKTVPADTAVTILRVNVQPPIFLGKPTDIQCKLATATVFQDPSVAGSYKYFAIDEQVQYHWKLKEEAALFNLPTVSDSNKVGAVRWRDPEASYDWSYSVTLPGNNAYAITVATNSTSLDTATKVQFGLPFPTDPVLAQLSCFASRRWEYDYKAYDSQGNPLGIFTKTDVASYSANVTLLVRDQTPPQIVSINGAALPNLTLQGRTGDTLSSVTGNPTTLQVVVRDNNPFGNATPTCPITGISRHSKAKQMGSFQYETGAGKVLVPLSTLPALASDTGLTAAQIKANVQAGNPVGSVAADDAAKVLWYSAPGQDLLANGTTDTLFKVSRSFPTVPAGSLFSEVAYSLDISSLRHFSRADFSSTPADKYEHPTRLPLNFANNAPGYDNAGGIPSPHAGYGIAVSAQDASGLRDNRVMVGNIEVLDNKRPVLYLLVTDMKSNLTEAVPFDISAFSDPNLASESIHGCYNMLGNTETWKPDSTGVFSSGFTIYAPTLLGFPPPAITDLGVFAAQHPQLIDNEVETILQLRWLDNIAVATATAVAPRFTLKGPDSGSLYFKDGMTEVTLNAGLSENYTVRTLFRQPGVYRITAEVKDTALNLARSDNANNRKLEFGLVVVPTTMTIRVLDRESNRK